MMISLDGVALVLWLSAIFGSYWHYVTAHNKHENEGKTWNSKN